MNWYLFFDILVGIYGAIGGTAVLLYLSKAKTSSGESISAKTAATGSVMALVSIAYLIARL